MAEVNIVAFIRIKPEAIETARPTVQELVNKTRAEPGNLRYDLFQDVKEDGTFILIEKFANQ
jgi:quinol monooxygenase YgiN